MKYWQKFIELLKKIFSKIGYFKLDSLKTINWKVLLVGIAGIFFIFYLIFISFWLNLPEDKLKYLLEQKLKENLPKNIQIEIGYAKTTWSSLDLNNVLLELDQLNTDKILLGNVNINFVSWHILLLDLPINVKGPGIDIEILYNLGSDSVTLKADDLSLNNIPNVRKLNLLSGLPSLNLNLFYDNKQQILDAEFTILNLKLNSSNDLIKIIPKDIKDTISFSEIKGTAKFDQQNKQINFTTQGVYNGSTSLNMVWGGDVSNSDYKITTNGQIAKEVIDKNKDLFEILAQPYIEGQDVNLNISFNGFFSNISIQKNQ